MKCSYCGLEIMKADNFCSSCATPNQRNEHAEQKMKTAVLGVAELLGVDTKDADGANGETAWEEFKRQMWPPVSS